MAQRFSDLYVPLAIIWLLHKPHIHLMMRQPVSHQTLTHTHTWTQNKIHSHSLAHWLDTKINKIQKKNYEFSAFAKYKSQHTLLHTKKIKRKKNFVQKMCSAHYMFISMLYTHKFDVSGVMILVSCLMTNIAYVVHRRQIQFSKVWFENFDNILPNIHTGHSLYGLLHPLPLSRSLNLILLH